MIARDAPVTKPKVLVLSGSTRNGSFNTQLAAIAAREFDAAGAQATLASMADYPMDLVDAGNSGGAMPVAVQNLHALFAAHDGVVLATPEYNAFPSPLLLNTLDWLSRLRHYEGGMDEVFGRPLYAVMAASPSPIGGYRALMALRQKLEIGLGATVIPAMAHVAAAFQAFDPAGQLNSENDRTMLGKVVRQLLARLAHRPH
jgi:chromate reductase, NAD(P)H dehydrogenase (quinone)